MNVEDTDLPIDVLIKFVSLMFTAESPEGRTARFEKLLPSIVARYPGDILEIGAGVGMTTKVLVKFGHVVVVDPWEELKDQPAGYGVYSYEEFLKNVDSDNMEVIKKPSSEITKFDRHFCFAFIDGLQRESEVLHDLYLAKGTDVISVDDYNRNTLVSQVPKAVTKFLDQNPEYSLVETRENLIECYLCKSF